MVGTADAAGRPVCCRAVALLVDPGGKKATGYLPVATSSETIANLATSGWLALVTATAPVSHASVQLKGRSRGVRLAGEDELPSRLRESLDRFAEVLADNSACRAG